MSDPLKHPGDGRLTEADVMIASVAPMASSADFDWHAWAERKSVKQVGDMLAMLAWRLRCEAANNTKLGAMLQEVMQ